MELCSVFSGDCVTDGPGGVCVRPGALCSGQLLSGFQLSDWRFLLQTKLAQQLILKVTSPVRAGIKSLTAVRGPAGTCGGLLTVCPEETLSGECFRAVRVLCRFHAAIKICGGGSSK